MIGPRVGRLRPTPAAVVLVVVLSILLRAAPAQAASVECRGLYLRLNPDGSVEASLRIDYTGAVAGENISVAVPGAPVYVEAESGNGTLLPAYAGNGSIVVTIPWNGSGSLAIRYVALDLTSKQGMQWVFEASLPCTARVLLPQGAAPSLISPEPRIAVENGSVVFVFPPGQARIEYFLTPQIGEGGQTGGTANATTGTPGAPGAEGQEERSLWPLLVVALVLALGGAAAYYLVARARRPGNPGGDSVSLSVEGLDERDRAIIEALRGSSEGKTASQLMEETGIPKTPLYRRLNKLERMGIIEHYDEGGVRRYRLRRG